MEVLSTSMLAPTVHYDGAIHTVLSTSVWIQTSTLRVPGNFY